MNQDDPFDASHQRRSQSGGDNRVPVDSSPPLSRNFDIPRVAAGGEASGIAFAAQLARGSISDSMDSAARRAELEKQMREAFRERQRQTKARQVEHVVLGKGLGARAETTLADGVYQPRMVLQPITEAQKELWQTIDLGKIQHSSEQLGNGADEEDEDSAGPSDPVRCKTHREEEPLLERFRSTYSAVNAILQVRAEVSANITMAEEELDSVCAPFVFAELLESLSIALEVLEDGHPTMRVALPVLCREEPSPDPALRAEQRRREVADPLVVDGAEALLPYLREQLMPLAYELVHVTHTAQWVVQYSVAFLRSLSATNTDEAQVRLELLARCVRLVGKTEKFSSVVLLIEAKMEEYDAFHTLRDSAEQHIGALLDGVEKTLRAVHELQFPLRRARLRLVERGIKQKLQRTMLFLNEIDYHWTPNVRLHAAWKSEFLSGALRRIHCVISPLFSLALMGFVDEAVYKLVTDSRVTGKLHGAAPIQPQVPAAYQIEYERVTEGLTLQQVGMQVRGYASIVVGAQVCMGARYVLRQCTQKFNKDWGFEMNEKAEAPTKAEVNNFMADIQAKARSRVQVGRARAADRPPLSPSDTTFLTQQGAG